VKIGDFSTELCGGTHTGAAVRLGWSSCSVRLGVSSGVRRVEAVTGLGALSEFRRGLEVTQLAGQFAAPEHLSPADALRSKLSSQEEEIKKLRRELDQVRNEVRCFLGRLGCQPSRLMLMESRCWRSGSTRWSAGSCAHWWTISATSSARGLWFGFSPAGWYGRPHRRVYRGSHRPSPCRENHHPPRAEGWRLRRRSAGHGGGRRERRIRAERSLGECSDVIRELLGRLRLAFSVPVRRVAKKKLQIPRLRSG